MPEPRRVAGIVADLKYVRPDAPVAPESYLSWQSAPGIFSLEIAARTASDPAVVLRRLNLLLLGSFALVALAMAIVGIYGVMAHAVAERTREIGVRMALGARRAQVMAMVVREAAAVAGAGLALGLAAAWPATRALAGLLYDVAPHDPAIFAAVAFTLAATALAACIGPALRASRVDPAIALRAE